jgi:hypothetical protein
MPPDPKYIAKLQEAILATHGCPARRITTVPVKEVFQGKTAWEGEVEVFSLKGHATAKYCYAWAYEEGGTTHTTAVLGLPPVDSAETAVKVAIAASAKSK